MDTQEYIGNKRAPEQIDSHPRCCLVTLDHEDYAAVQVAHMNPHLTKTHQAEALRKAWASVVGLEVDAANNLIYLRSDIHTTFDRGYWALFPQEDLLNDVTATQELNVRNRVPQLKNFLKPKVVQDMYKKYAKWNNKSTFTYSFVWIGRSSGVKGAPILRKQTPFAEMIHSDPIQDQDLPDHVRANELFDIQAQLKFSANILAGTLQQLLDPHITTQQLDNASYKKECDALRLSIDKLLDMPSAHDNAHWRSHIGVLKDASVALGTICDLISPELSQADPVSIASTGAVGYSHTQALRHALASITELIQEYHVHVSPYSNFPALESHIHPLFAIENAGKKLCHLSEEELVALDPRAISIAFLYCAWHDLDLLAHSNVSDGPQDHSTSEDGASHPSTDDDHQSQDEAPGHGSHTSEAPPGRAPQGNSKSRQVADINTSAGTPSLTHDEKSSVSEELPDIETRHYDTLADWAAACSVDPDVELTNDRQLRKDSEKPKRLRPQEWERWAKYPPKLPEVIMPEHDTSQLTSYHWALYHQNINLVAPYGSHKVPEPHCIPWEAYASRDCDCP